MKIIFNTIGIIIVGFIFLIILFFKLLWKILKFFWKFTPWARAKRIRDLQRLDKEEREYNEYLEKLKNGWIERTNPLIFVDGKIKYIYVYTTDTEKIFNRYKVGETKKSPYDRIQEQDTTSNSGQLNLVAYWHAGKASDKQIHNLLESYGYIRIRKNREWFVIDDPMVTIPKLLKIANS